MTKQEMIERYIRGYEKAIGRDSHPILRTQLKRYNKTTLQMMIEREGY